MTYDAEKEAVARVLIDTDCRATWELTDRDIRQYGEHADRILAKLAEMGYRPCDHAWGDAMAIGRDPEGKCIKCGSRKPPPETET